MKYGKILNGFEELYQINNLGNIRNKKGNIIKSYPNKQNYLRVSLRKNDKQKTYLVHRLVALTFMPNPENKPQVNHINGIKDDNRIENLEWCTQSDNNKHAWEQGLKIVTKKHSNASKENGEKYRSIKINQYDLQGKYIKTWNSVREAERTLKMYGISQCCKGKCKTIGGYIWKYRSDTNAN